MPRQWSSQWWHHLGTCQKGTSSVGIRCGHQTSRIRPSESELWECAQHSAHYAFHVIPMPAAPREAGAKCSALLTRLSLTAPYEVGTVTSPALQRRKLRFRGIERLASLCSSHESVELLKLKCELRKVVHAHQVYRCLSTSLSRSRV